MWSRKKKKKGDQETIDGKRSNAEGTCVLSYRSQGYDKDQLIAVLSALDVSMFVFVDVGVRC